MLDKMGFKIVEKGVGSADAALGRLSEVPRQPLVDSDGGLSLHPGEQHRGRYRIKFLTLLRTRSSRSAPEQRLDGTLWITSRRVVFVFDNIGSSLGRVERLIDRSHKDVVLAGQFPLEALGRYETEQVAGMKRVRFMWMNHDADDDDRYYELVTSVDSAEMAPLGRTLIDAVRDRWTEAWEVPEECERAMVKWSLGEKKAGLVSKKSTYRWAPEFYLRGDMLIRDPEVIGRYGASDLKELGVDA